MQARTRVVLVSGVGAVVCLATAVIFVSQSMRDPSPLSEPAPVAVHAAPVDSQVFAATSGASELQPTASVTESAAEMRQQYVLGLNLRRLGRHSEAEAAFAAALVHAPDNVRVLVNAARTQLDLGHPESAETLVAKATEVAPADGDAWNVLGRSRWECGDITGAAAAFARACAVDTSHAWAHNNLGLLRLQQGEFEAALPLLEAAVQLNRDVAAFHHNLAIAYERSGRPSDATTEYARTLELRPDHLRAQAALDRLKSNTPQLADGSAADSTANSTANRIQP